MKKLLLVIVVLALCTTAFCIPEKYSVCHVNARHGMFDYYNYLEVGTLNGHFINGNPNLPKHGAWDPRNHQIRWDFVTEEGDFDCDGKTDYEPCDETVVLAPVESEHLFTYGEWSKWKYDDVRDLEYRTRSYVETWAVTTNTVDAKDNSYVCGTSAEPFSREGTEEQTSIAQPYYYVVCSGVYYYPDTYGTPTLIHEWTRPNHLETWKLETDKGILKFEEPKECKECVEKKMYYQFTLESGDQTCYMVSWDQKEDGGFYIPNAMRQQCVCGFVAENASYGGWVTKNTCSGEYTYHGQTWRFFKDDLIEPHWDGSCGMGC